MTCATAGGCTAATRARRIARGALFSGPDYVQAQRFRFYFKKAVAAVMADLDVLITPTSTTPAEKVADRWT